jgi:hypothetical protein
VAVRIALSLLFALTGLAAHAEDWPQFRGPTGQGHSTERDLPLEWSESRNVVWKTPVPGRGWSSPVVVGGRIWLTSAVRERDGTSLRTLAVDADTGREAVNVELLTAIACTCTSAPRGPRRSPRLARASGRRESRS